MTNETERWQRIRAVWRELDDTRAPADLAERILAGESGGAVRHRAWAVVGGALAAGLVMLAAVVGPFRFPEVFRLPVMADGGAEPTIEVARIRPSGLDRACTLPGSCLPPTSTSEDELLPEGVSGNRPAEAINLSRPIPGDIDPGA